MTWCVCVCVCAELQTLCLNAPLALQASMGHKGIRLLEGGLEWHLLRLGQVESQQIEALVVQQLQLGAQLFLLEASHQTPRLDD